MKVVLGYTTNIVEIYFEYIKTSSRSKPSFSLDNKASLVYKYGTGFAIINTIV
jgi:hypothetical protein